MPEKGTKKQTTLRGAERDAARERFTARYLAGESIRDLAEDSGRSYGSIHALLREAGVLRAAGRPVGRGNRRGHPELQPYGHAVADPSTIDLAADLARHGLILKEDPS